MYSALDIAKWFINYNLKLRNIDNEDIDYITNLKVQKLLYYAQGSILALENKLLFTEDILAWSHGPVVKSVYDKFKSYGSSDINEYYNDIYVDEETEKVLLQVYNVFGRYSAWGLRNMIHQESSWIDTKRNEVIQVDKIKNIILNTLIRNKNDKLKAYDNLMKKIVDISSYSTENFNLLNKEKGLETISINQLNFKSNGLEMSDDNKFISIRFNSSKYIKHVAFVKIN